MRKLRHTKVTCHTTWSNRIWIWTQVAWRRQWHPTPVLLPGKSHGRGSLVLQSLGLQQVGHDWAASLSLFTFIIGEGDGNPLQGSCLENPRDRGAWWAAVYGVARSRTWLKRLSSCSSKESDTKRLSTWPLLLRMYNIVKYNNVDFWESFGKQGDQISQS